jgi:2-polyprenyl-3-methyl-5-hydroxy-6-metoxy-1,4-benzoquinol methylase
MGDVLVTSDDINLDEWEKRSIFYGNSYKSVLFKTMPDIVNKHFHMSHLKFIYDCIENIKEDSRILDIGCGYGRITMPLLQKLPKAEIIGIDISKTYVSLYKKNTGKDAFVSSIETIPDNLGTFDLIISATVMMYVPKHQLQFTVKNLLKKLNPGGKLIMIEPDISGINYQTGFGILNLIKKNIRSGNIHAGGHCFSSAELSSLIQEAGGILIKEQRIPATTFFFLPMYALGKLLPKRLAATFFQPLSFMDNILKTYKFPTLWLFDLIQRR